MLGLNPMEQEIIDLTNNIVRNGYIYFPEFCKVIHEKYRQDDDEIFSQNMFKVMKKLKIHFENSPSFFNFFHFHHHNENQFHLFRYNCVWNYRVCFQLIKAIIGKLYNLKLFRCSVAQNRFHRMSEPKSTKFINISLTRKTSIT